MDISKTDSRARPEFFLWPWAAATYPNMTGISPSQFTSLNSQVTNCQNLNSSITSNNCSRMNIPTTSQSLNSILLESNLGAGYNQPNRNTVSSVAMALASVTAGSNNSSTTNPIINGRNSLLNDPVRRSSSNKQNEISSAAAALAALSDQHNLPINEELKVRSEYLKTMELSSSNGDRDNHSKINNPSNSTTNSESQNYSDDMSTLMKTDIDNTISSINSNDELMNRRSKSDPSVTETQLHNSINVQESSNDSALTPGSSYNQSTKSYKCKLCHSVCYSKSDLATHNAVNHNQDPRPHRCEQCGRQFSTCAYLSQHRRIHTGNKPYTCRFCERRFTQLSHQQQHERIHTGEKPYKCAHCSKAFTQMSNLQSHQRQHMKGKPHRCEHCFLSFDCKNELEEHLQAKHIGVRYTKVLVCPYCSKSYNSETYLSKHVERHKEAGSNGNSFQFSENSRSKNTNIHSTSGQEIAQNISAASSLYLSMNGVNSTNGNFENYANSSREMINNQLHQSVIQNQSTNTFNQLQASPTEVQQLLANQTMLMKLEQQHREQNQNLVLSSNPVNSSNLNLIANDLDSHNNLNNNRNNEMSGSYSENNLSSSYSQHQIDSNSISRTVINGSKTTGTDGISPESIAAVARAFQFNSKINRVSDSTAHIKDIHLPNNLTNETEKTLEASSQKDSVQNFSRSLDIFLQATNNQPILGEKSNFSKSQQNSQLQNSFVNYQNIHNRGNNNFISRKRATDADANNNSHDETTFFNAQKLFFPSNPNEVITDNHTSTSNNKLSTPNKIFTQSMNNHNYERSSINEILFNGRLDELLLRHQQNSTSIV